MPKIANRREELDLFARMLRGAERKRALFLEAPSEGGKSILLAELAALAEEILGQGCCACADFKGGGLGLEELLSGFRDYLGADVLSGYTRHPIVVPSQVNVQADLSGARMGDENTVLVQPVTHFHKGGSTQSRAAAVVQDFLTCKKPLALIIDTFEAATEEPSLWIVQQLLGTVRHNARLCIVIAGQRVPDPRDHLLTWGKLAMRRVLSPVRSVEAWHEFALSQHPRFPRHHIETVCMGGLTNRPSAVHQLIETIAQQLPPYTGGKVAL